MTEIVSKENDRVEWAIRSFRRVARRLKAEAAKRHRRRRNKSR